MRIVLSITLQALVERLNDFVQKNHLKFFDFYGNKITEKIDFNHIDSEIQFNIMIVDSDFEINPNKDYILDYEPHAVNVQQITNNALNSINITVFTWKPKESSFAKDIGHQLKKYIASFAHKGMTLPENSLYELHTQFKKELAGYFYDKSVLQPGLVLYDWLGAIEIKPNNTIYLDASSRRYD